MGLRRSEMKRHTYDAGEMSLIPRHLGKWFRNEDLHGLCIGISDAALADVYAFLKATAPPAPGSVSAAPAGNAGNGKALFAKAGCYECHDYQGQGGAGTGPRLAPNPIAFPAFMAQCRQPVNEMPPYTSKVLSDGELADIYAYLQSIPAPPAASSVHLLP